MKTNNNVNNRSHDETPADDKHSLLERKRVNQLFSKALENAIVVVSAGAGYGKSQAISNFLKERSEYQIWIELSEIDNQTTRFWEHYSYAFERFHKRTGERLAELGFPYKSLMGRYREILGDEKQGNSRYIFVIDDFHNVTDADVRGFFNEVIECLPESVSLIIASRTEPALNLMPQLMKGRVSYITEDDLRFTKQETAAFLNGKGVSLSADSLAAVCEDTKGWAFAVNLIGKSLEKYTNDFDARSAMKTNIHRMIEMDVFSAVSLRLQRFLVQLSLISQPSASLVHALANDEDLISELECASSFIRYDTYLHAYRIHHLFLDFLVGRQYMLTEDEKKETWRKAAEWCAESNLLIDAVSYYEKAGDYGEIIDLIQLRLPQQIPFKSAEFLKQVFEEAPSGAFDGVLIAHVIYLRILLSMSRVEEALGLADELVQKYKALPEDAANCRVLSSLYSALAIGHWMMAPQTDNYDFAKYFEMEEYYYSKFPFGYSGPTSSQTVFAYASMVGTERKGALEEYICAMKKSVPHISAVLKGCMMGLDTLALGEMYFFKADLKSAEIEIKNAFATAEQNHQHDIRNRALFYLLRIYMAQGKYDSAEWVIDRLEAQLEITEYLERQLTFDIVTAWYYMRINMPEFVAPWLRDDFEENALGEYFMDFANLMKALLYYESSQYEVLHNFVKTHAGVGRALYGKIGGKLIEALCHYHLKNRAAAFEAFEAAYELSLSNELIMPFIERGKDMRTLTTAAKKSGSCRIPDAWLDDINRRSAIYAKHLNTVAASYRKANNLDDEVRLSPLESKILTSLADGLSRSEIAVQHNLSINTIKTVINMIYLKLGATGAADAIRIAVERKLL
ncbi:hypothetical protein AGMMS49983_11520 [Clostridia bacterium]|nr:hypothetical protein AGMMS49983_11520 [Clostridia bacterium]